MTWVHSLDPFALQVTESFGLRWYGLAYLAGFVLGYLAVLKVVRAGRTQFKAEQLADFVTFVAIGVLVGGRLGYAVFYAPELLTTFDGAFPYWGVFKVNEGGMASHGGIIGVMLVCWLYAHYHRISPLHALDLTVFGAALGFFFGRIANFINGELYGREAAATLPWAVKFPQETALWAQKDFSRLETLQPVMDALKNFKTSASEIIPVNAQIWLEWLKEYRTQFTAREKVLETLNAIIHRLQSGDTELARVIEPLLTPRHPSQLYQAVLEGLIVFLILVWVWRVPRKPGVLGALFGCLYCVARIIGEEFRLPDAHIGYQLFGLTRGQWISLGMLAVGLLFLFWATRRPAARLGGWRQLSVKE